MWNHSNVTRRDKLHFFESLVISRLQYGLATVCLNSVQRWRLDGFYARCLWRILKTPGAYVSRISNAIVYTRAGVQSFSSQLSRRQLLLLGRVVRSSPNSPLRSSVFVGDGCATCISQSTRRVGRPRLDWTTEIMKYGAGLKAEFHRRLETRERLVTTG